MPIDLVTGATGLLGGNLVRALIEDGRVVRALTRKQSNTTFLQGLPGLELIEGDVTDPGSLVNAFREVARVYHCAAVTSLWSGAAEQLWRVNVEGTVNVIEAVKRVGVERLIHCSTVDALGVSETDTPATEETAWNWDRLGVENPYARTKFEAQKRVAQAAGKTIDAVIVNPATMFGAYDLRPSSGQIILLVAGGKLLFYPTGGDNFIDARDVARAMITAAETGVCGERYILGHENVTYREIFSRIAAILRVTPPRFATPYPVARIGGWFGDIMSRVAGKEYTINTSTVQLSYLNHYYSSAKAIRELHLAQTPVDQAIEQAVRWFYDTGMIRR
jgi:dihydroflavonol-4-reductase